MSGGAKTEGDPTAWRLRKRAETGEAEVVMEEAGGAAATRGAMASFVDLMDLRAGSVCHGTAQVAASADEIFLHSFLLAKKILSNNPFKIYYFI